MKPATATPVSVSACIPLALSSQPLNCVIVAGGGASSEARLRGASDPVAHLVQAHNSAFAAPAHNADPLAAATWCAVQVRPGHERAMAHRIERIAGANASGAATGSAVLDTLVLRRELPFRQDGVWGVRTDLLFPGYVLVATGDIDALESQLNLITEFHQLVRQGDTVATLAPEEVALIRSLGGSTRTVGISMGEIIAGELVVRRGPLMGRENIVAKIDRHKRVAYLDPTAFPRITDSVGPGVEGRRFQRRMPRVGLEVMAKS